MKDLRGNETEQLHKKKGRMKANTKEDNIRWFC